MGTEPEVSKVLEIKKALEKSEIASSDCLSLMSELSELRFSEQMLKKTKIAFTLDRLRKASTDAKVQKTAKDLIKKWKKDTEPPKEKSATPPKDTSSVKPAFEFTSPIPKKNKKGQLVFEDHPEFKPNLTPREVLQAGSFGGTYFRPIYSSVTKQKYGAEVWKELPQEWLEGLNIKTQVASPIYDVNKNKYKAKCGGSLEMWEESGWMREQDPYGWFQWYCRFYQGRRTKDDARQIDRWAKCTGEKGRWKNNLITKIFKAGAKFNNPAISPVIRQVLLHWAYELTEEDYQKRAKTLSK